MRLAACRLTRCAFIAKEIVKFRCPRVYNGHGLPNNTLRAFSISHRLHGNEAQAQELHKLKPDQETPSVSGSQEVDTKEEHGVGGSQETDIKEEHGDMDTGLDKAVTENATDKLEHRDTHTVAHAASTEPIVKPIHTENIEQLPKWTNYSDRLNPMILQTLKDNFGYKTMTKVQQTIMDMVPMQTDLLVRSKTGTGKTLAFLIPALQRSLEKFDAAELSGSYLKTYANKHASVFIISPTRELANQIATEARRLVSIPGSNMKALCCVGGDSKRDQLKLLRRERNDFIVGTPGRLLDLLENHEEFADRVRSAHTFILDEADTLLEMGFRKELESIISYLPKERQTYMFSATVSREIQNISRLFLSPDHKFLNTVAKDDQDSHAKIKQEYIIRPGTEHLQVVLSLIISQQLKNKDSKIIVFLPTTKLTMLYSALFKVLRRLYPNPAFQQFDIHSQRSQESRSKVSNAFRTANAGSVLFTSDVSARGVDYPGVSLVIQVGAAGSRDLYIHRVGRTGRAGLTGEGVLILQPFEEGFLHTLGKDIPITEKDFPDSEIALGLPQQKVFDLMYKLAPPELVADTFISMAGAMLPRSQEYRQDRMVILDAIKSWWQTFAGDAAPPQISPMLLGGSRNGRGSSRGPPRRRNDSGDRFGSYQNEVRKQYSSPRSRPMRSASEEYRPTRPSEVLWNGDRRKDFSRSIPQQYVDATNRDGGRRR